MIEVLADNKRFLDTITRYEQALREIENCDFNTSERSDTAEEAAHWMNQRATEALGDLS